MFRCLNATLFSDFHKNYMSSLQWRLKSCRLSSLHCDCKVHVCLIAVYKGSSKTYKKDESGNIWSVTWQFNPGWRAYGLSGSTANHNCQINRYKVATRASTFGANWDWLEALRPHKGISNGRMDRWMDILFPPSPLHWPKSVGLDLILSGSAAPPGVQEPPNHLSQHPVRRAMLKPQIAHIFIF